MRKFFSLILFLMIISSGCNRQNVETSFYHWEQTVDLSEQETLLLTKNNVSNLYIRIFDVDYKDKSELPAILSNIFIKKMPPENINLIPCIYITNRSFRDLNFELVDSFSQHVAAHVIEIQKLNKLSFSNEIQIDCDWTQATRKYYFAFIKHLRDYLPQFNTISATIRLHQYKYPKKTGVPPVDKGTLMVYNMGEFGDANAKNAIYDNAILKQYLSNVQAYPLHLDIAMPLFNWALVFRFGKAMKIINNPQLSSLNESNERFSHIAENKYKVLLDGYWQGLYLYKGDVLRIDKVSADDIKKGLAMIKKNGLIIPERIIYYHIFEEVTQQYSYENFEDFSSVFN